MTTWHRSKRPLGTIWRIPDDLWVQLQPLLPPEKRLGTNGRPVVPFRQVMDGILYVLRTGCQWKALPQEYGSGSTCHRRFQEWVQAGAANIARSVGAIQRAAGSSNVQGHGIIASENSSSALRKRMENYRGLVH